jgi:hypothetical protein
MCSVMNTPAYPKRPADYLINLLDGDSSVTDQLPLENFFDFAVEGISQHRGCKEHANEASRKIVCGNRKGCRLSLTRIIFRWYM